MRDHSCYIALRNDLDVPLTLLDFGAKHGDFVSMPALSIAAGETSAECCIRDRVGIHGSEGYLRYRPELADVSDVNQRPIVDITFGAPARGYENWYSVDCVSGLGNALLGFSYTDFVKSNFPLRVTGAIGYNDGIKTSTGISSIRIQNPTLNVSNTQEPPAIRKTENQLLWESVAEPDVYIDDSMDRVTGSFSPVTTDLTTDATLDVVLDIDEHLVGIPFQLCGDLGENLNVICNTTIHYFQAIGPRTISVSVLPSWRSTTFPWGLAGDVIWRVYIKPTMQSITITTTRLEIYGLAAALPSFFANQVSVAFLRTLVLPARKSGETDWTWYVIRELSETYGRLRFQYDARWGAPHFDVGPYGGNFELGLWTRRCTIRNAPINCYDLAGILQIAVGLAPEVKCAWKFMAPFGYLLQTNLIGVGCCNNPFYQSNNTTPIIGNNDVRRTAFGNHAFLSITSDAKHIADACAGPHVVSEDLQGYIKAAIQEAGTGPGQTTLYDEWWNYPGTVADVVSATGITSINARSLLMEDLEAIQPSIAIMNAMDMAAKGSEVGSKIEITNLDIPIVEGLLVARAGMKLLDRHHEVSAGGSELNWLLDSEPYPTEIKIAVLASALHAQVYFQNELGKYERPLEHVFSSPPTDIRKGHLCLTSSGAVETHSVMTWTHGNVFVCIAAPLSLRNLDVVYAAPLAEYMWNRESNALQSPTLLRLEAPVGNVTVGQEFMIKAIVDSCAKATVRSKNGSTVLLSQDPTTLSFHLRSERPGADNLLFAFAHGATGAVTFRVLEVIAVERGGPQVSFSTL